MDDASLQGLIGLAVAVTAALIAGRNAAKKRRWRGWVVLCLFCPPLLLILLLLPSKTELTLEVGTATYENDRIAGRVTIETHERGLFGRLVALAFWGWHAMMTVLLIALIAYESQGVEGGADSANVALSGGLLLLVVWLLGAAILGLMMFFTRGKKVSVTRQV